MSDMDGNVFIDDAMGSMKSARNAGVPHDNEAAYLLQEAQIEATLALVYEQRTANLIAWYGYGDLIKPDTILARLGLNETRED